MGKWLDELQENLSECPTQSLPKVTKVPTENSFVTFVTPSPTHLLKKTPPKKVRIIQKIGDFNDQEKTLYQWLRGRGLVTKYEIAAGVSISLDDVATLLADWDRHCFLVWCDDQVALNAYARQRLGPIETNVSG